MAPMGFLVTWQRIVCPALSTSSMRGCCGRPALDVVAVVADVAPVEDGVLRDADVDEGRLHAGQHVLDPAPVDVAVDLVGVVGGPGDVVLDQGPALEHGDLGHVGLDVHADQVAADLLASARSRPERRRPRAGFSPPSASLGASPFGRGPRTRLRRLLVAARWRRAGTSGTPGPARAASGGGAARGGPGVADLGLAACARALPRCRRAGACTPPAGPRLRGATLRGLADFRLGHEGGPSSRAVSRPRRSRARSAGSGSHRAPSRSIH